MISIESSMNVPGMRSATILGFMLHPTDDIYQIWWPGVHFSMHPLNDVSGVGQLVVMDELVGDRRVNMHCRVTELGTDRITWQFRRIIDLPCWLTIEIVDDERGATITHTITAGYRRWPGRVLDPLLRVYFSGHFARMMHEHFTYEFSVLPEILDRLGVASA